MVVLNKSMNTSKSLPFKSQCFLTLWPIENSGSDTMWLVNLGHKRPCISTLFTGILSLGPLLFHVRNLAILKPPWWKGHVQVYLGQYLQLSLTFQKFLPRQLQVNEVIWDRSGMLQAKMATVLKVVFQLPKYGVIGWWFQHLKHVLQHLVWVTANRVETACRLALESAQLVLWTVKRNNYICIV